MTSRYDGHQRTELYLTCEFKQIAKRRTGSFADVYPVKIAGQSSNLVFALKKPRCSDDEAFNQKMRGALEKEITALQLVDHPHIIKFYGLVTEFELPCVLTPWFERGNLRRHLRSHPDVDKRRILSQVAAALAHLHSGSATPDGSIIIHGDIHAGNILIDDDGNALLGDFGLCKLVPPGDLASLSQRFGMPHGAVFYMAPELHNAGARRSTASDAFAFGILIAATYNAGTTPTLASRPKGDTEIITALRAGERPSEVRGMGRMWQIACECWSQSPQQRPSMNSVRAKINVLS